MRITKIKTNSVLFFAGLAALVFYAASFWFPSSRVNLSNPALSFPAATLVPSDGAATESSIRFFSERVKKDPEDYSGQNKLAAYCLQRVRETSSEDFLPLAIQAARASLDSVPAERNFSGLIILARAEFANHEFAKARDHALQLVKLAPEKGESYATLGDALLELGDYEKTDAAFQQMERLSPGTVETETRLARLALLRGQTEQAQEHFRTALLVLLDFTNPPRETVAWCRWQLGEVFFSVGDYKNAERQYRDALITFPGYFHALASMGKLSAARGELREAMTKYREAIQGARSPDFVAALGDLHKLAGQEKEAAKFYVFVEELGKHSMQVHGTLQNRQLALFHADHDMQLEQAYASALSEYGVRKDIYGADALAWTAFKSGRLTEAKAAMKEALRLGTKDAKLFYHAGMIARASGEKTLGSDYFKCALALNPQSRLKREP
ncbi:MAG: tetratricopeptide repeat protein [Verrucomicrobiota bacterium]